MNTILEKALPKLPKLTDKDQTVVAEFILARTEAPMKTTAQEKAAIADGMADSDAGRFGTEEQYQATLTRLRNA